MILLIAFLVILLLHGAVIASSIVYLAKALKNFRQVEYNGVTAWEHLEEATEEDGAVFGEANVEDEEEVNDRKTVKGRLKQWAERILK